jgi:hypothetical protein
MGKTLREPSSSTTHSITGHVIQLLSTFALFYMSTIDCSIPAAIAHFLTECQNTGTEMYPYFTNLLCYETKNRNTPGLLSIHEKPLVLLCFKVVF